MLLKGTLFLVTDPSSLQYYDSTNTRIIVISDSKNEPMLQNCLRGSILLPPYEASMFKCNNQNQEFYALYEQHLNSIEVLGYFSAIFKALMNGINIGIYSKPEELEMYFGEFSNILMNNFGIVIATPQNAFMFNDAYTAKILSLMYDFDMISYHELMNMYPQHIHFPESNIMKIAKELNIDGTLQDMELYFFNMKENKFKIVNPFIKVSKEEC